MVQREQSRDANGADKTKQGCKWCRENKAVMQMVEINVTCARVALLCNNKIPRCPDLVR